MTAAAIELRSMSPPPEDWFTAKRRDPGRMPPIAAIVDPRTKTDILMRSTLIPARRTASAFPPTAKIDRPYWVRVVTKLSRMITAIGKPPLIAAFSLCQSVYDVERDNECRDDPPCQHRSRVETGARRYITATEAVNTWVFGHSERSAEAGVAPSVGGVRDSYDNALAETVIGRYKTELIGRRRLWKNIESVEYATVECVDWFDNRRLLGPIGNVFPAEFKKAYYNSVEASAKVVGVE